MYTIFGERSKGQAKAPKRIGRRIDTDLKGQKDTSPNALALTELKNELQGYGITEERPKAVLVAEASRIESLRYMNMKTLAAALLLRKKLDGERIKYEVFLELNEKDQDARKFDYVTYIEEHPKITEYVEMTDDAFALIEKQAKTVIAKEVVNIAKTYRTINKELQLSANTLLTRDQQKNNDLRVKHMASILRYLRMLYMAKQEEEHPDIIITED